MNRPAGRNLVAALAAAIAVVLTPASASAITAPIHISGTGTDGVNIRPTPDTSLPAVGWMPEGTSPDYTCFTYGEQVGNVNVWFQITYSGISGFYASYWDDSHYASEAELTSRYGVPKCGTTAPADAPEAPPTPAAATPAAPGLSYNRTAAAKWGKDHARDTPPMPSACTWFVSKALWAGGLPKSDTWTSAGHNGRRQRPGSQTAWYAPAFVDYIRKTFPRSTYTALNLRGNKVPAARPGDVIAYAWDGGASASNTKAIDHLSLVVNIASGQYPEVSEWSVSDAGPWGRPTEYTKRGWTWSQKSHTWLQRKSPKVQAFLLHIDTGA